MKHLIEVVDDLEKRKVGFSDPMLQKSEGFRSFLVRGEAVVGYRNALVRKDLESSGFPEPPGRSFAVNEG